MGWIARLFGKRPVVNVVEMPPISVGQPVFVIGDVHGRFDLLEKLLAKAVPGEQIICVGDYVDRGDNSAGVLRLLMSRDDVICLMGNHEQMMLKFLDNPEKAGSRWLRYGGLQTLASFGVSGVTETSKGELLTQAATALIAAMGPEMVEWLRGLPVMFETGNLTVVHAGADPTMPISMQGRSTLMWGHADFATVMRTDGRWIAHGHTIVDQPSAENGKISTDTGAYATGTLTAARINDGDIGFVVA